MPYYKKISQAICIFCPVSEDKLNKRRCVFYYLVIVLLMDRLKINYIALNPVTWLDIGLLSLNHQYQEITSL